MEFKYKGGTAFITGANELGRGGAVTAGHLAREGMDIILHYRSDKEVRQVREYVLRAGSKYPIKVDLVQGDLSDRRTVDRIFSEISPDIVVNNAAIFGTYKKSKQEGSKHSTAEYESAEYERVLDAHYQSNVKAIHFVSEAAIEKMKRKGGGVVFIVDDAWLHRGGVYPVGHGPYTSSKGHSDYVLHLAAVNGPYNVRVLGIAPGPTEPVPGTPEHVIQSIQRRIRAPKSKLNPWIGFDRIAEAIVHLANVEGINGVMIPVDMATVAMSDDEHE